MDVVELAPDVSPAGDLGDLLAVEPVEPGIAVGVEIAPERPQMLGRALRLAVGRVAEQHGGRRIAGVAALVANIGPQPPRPGATDTGREHRDRRVVGVQRGSAHNMPFERIDQRVEELG